MKLEQFKQVFASYTELIEERLISRKQACVTAASLFPPVIGKEISIAHMYCDGFIHYGLSQMIAHASN